MKHTSGFTLIEIFISLTIIIGIGASLLFLLGNKKTGALQSNAEIIAARLSEVQSRAIAGVSGSSWGMHFNNVTSTSPFYDVFEGSSYSTTTYQYQPTNEIEFQTPASGTSTDIAFTRLTGRIGATSTIVIRLKLNTSETKTITVTPMGEITVSK